MGKEVLLAVIIVIVIYLLFVRPAAQPCYEKTHMLNGVEGTSAEICAVEGGMWDDAAKTCVVSEIAECDNPQGFVKDICIGSGGQYVAGCNICTGTVNMETDFDQMLSALTLNCPNMLVANTAGNTNTTL
jgi:hypothetical protein